MSIKWFYALFSQFLLAYGLKAQPSTDTVLRQMGNYFREIKIADMTPEAHVWGPSLSGPLLFVDHPTREVYANQHDKEGLLQPKWKIYAGQLPTSINIANTSLTWAGVKWIMVLLPLPKVPAKRISLVMHESFHRLQQSLGFPLKSPNCNHLDTEPGRIWLRLELAAMAKALEKPVTNRHKDLKNALLFREFRYSLFPEARMNEQDLEWNKGLAEFTGVYVSKIYVTDHIYLSSIPINAAQMPSFTRSFAYFTGPLYGILLSQVNKDWPMHIKPGGNFEMEIARAYHLGSWLDSLRSNLELLKVYAPQRAEGYNQTLVLRQETDRESERMRKARTYMNQFVKGPVLIVQGSDHMSFSFDPNNLFSLGDLGTIYPGMTITDDWGRLEVKGGALLKDWKYLSVPVDSSVQNQVNVSKQVLLDSGVFLFKGPGWELTLKKGWRLKPGKKEDLAPGSRASDFTVVKITL